MAPRMPLVAAAAVSILLLTFVQQASAASFPRSRSRSGNSRTAGISKDDELKFEGKNWAVLVAGSSGFFNYRHQADTCHANHVLRRNGFDADNIILMSYDDVADSSDNPFPGKLFNYPTEAGDLGYNVYRGCKEAVDYRGEDVTAANFLAVLTQNSTATGGKPVLKSTKDDRVFIYFADHGAPGIIAMPAGPPVYAQDLIAALTTMYDNEQYGQLVFYLEACESGSMFADGLLPDNIDIYATTAANSAESSWGTYCGMDAKVNGTLVGSCLGDLYSVMWMEDSDDVGRFHWESLDQQFAYVKEKTTMSHVQRFGDQSMGQEDVDIFMGVEDFPGLQRRMTPMEIEAVRNDGVSSVSSPSVGISARSPLSKTSKPAAAATAVTPRTYTSWDSRDIELLTLSHNYATATCPLKRKEWGQRLTDHIAHRQREDEKFLLMYRRATDLLDDGTDGVTVADDGAHELKMMTEYAAPVSLRGEEHMACHKMVNQAVIRYCGMYSDYSLKYVRTVGHICRLGLENKAAIAIETWVRDITQMIQEVCGGSVEEKGEDKVQEPVVEATM